MSSLTQRIAEFVDSARFEDIPANAIFAAKQELVFQLGLAADGAATTMAGHLPRVLMPMARGDLGAHVIGQSAALSASDAAFGNCSLMRATQRDSVINPAGVHAALVVLPGALAIGEIRRATGRDFLLAVILAYEAMGKLARARWAWDSPMPRRPTNIFGGLGAVTVASRLLSLPRGAFANAIGYAANIAMGIPEGGMMEHYYSFIARNGTLAAQLAEVGGTAWGADTIFDGQYGLYRSYFGDVPRDLEEVASRLGTDWEILTATHKQYPGTGGRIAGIELLRSIVRDHDVRLDDVVRIEAVLPSERRGRTELAGTGPFTSWTEATGSLPFGLALLLLDGSLTSERHSEGRMNDGDVAEVLRRIQVRYEDGRTGMYCRIAVQLRDGRSLSREAERIDFRLAREDWLPWLRRSGGVLVDDARLVRLDALIAGLEDVQDVSELVACLIPSH